MARRRKDPPGEYDYPAWTPPVVELPENAADAVLDLRRFAAMVWEETSGLFGCSRDLVKWIRMDRPFMRMATDWVRHLEMLMKRVVVILALSLNLAPVRRRASIPPGIETRLKGSHWAQPESWKVAFRMSPSRRRERAWRPGPPAQTPGLLVRTYGLARRLEALRRVISFTERRAVRFARALARRKARLAGMNDRPVLELRPWDFHPYRASKGMFAVREGMAIAHPLAARCLRVWQQDLLAPG